jgi:hypothetical protein
MTTTPDDARDLTSVPTTELKARTRGLVDEVLRRGVGVDELCSQLDVSQDELWRVLGR